MGIFRKQPRPEASPGAEKPASDIGSVVSYLATLRQNANTLNGNVSQALDTALLAGGKIGESIRAIENENHALHDRIGEASSAVEEITSTIAQTAQKLQMQEASIVRTGGEIEKVNANSANVAKITRQKTEDIQQLNEVMETGAQRVALTGQAIAEVTEMINEISGVVKVINGIAAQTNLLSMNAAIEAAHAGEAGKGFAVVAGEVRKLAESTQVNSKTIADSIKKIVNKIEEAKKTSAIAGKTIADIQAEANNFSEAFGEISRATSDLSTGMEEISKSMTEVRQFSGEIAEGSKEMTIGSQNIEQALRQITDYSGKIIDDMQTVHSQAVDITGAQSGISQFAVDNSKNMNGLYQMLADAGLMEKERSAFNYDLIVLMHRNWLAQLRAFLDDRKENLNVTPTDYEKCDLGKWIYGDGKAYETNSNYRKLVEQHKNFHLLAGDIYSAKKEGDMKKAEEHYRALMEEYHVVVGILTALKKDLG